MYFRDYILFDDVISLFITLHYTHTNYALIALGKVENFHCTRLNRSLIMKLNIKYVCLTQNYVSYLIVLSNNL